MAIEEASRNNRPSQLGQPCDEDQTSDDAFSIRRCSNRTQQQSGMGQPPDTDLLRSHGGAATVVGVSTPIQRTTDPPPSSTMEM